MHGKGVSAIALLSILSYTTAQEYTDFHAREAEPLAKVTANQVFGDIGRTDLYSSRLLESGTNLAV